jgi:hypothetical protein
MVSARRAELTSGSRTPRIMPNHPQFGAIR